MSTGKDKIPFIFHIVCALETRLLARGAIKGVEISLVFPTIEFEDCWF